jgi:hypothetical protein
MQPYVDAGKKVPKDRSLGSNRTDSCQHTKSYLGFNHNSAAVRKATLLSYGLSFPKFSLKADGTADISNPYTK